MDERAAYLELHETPIAHRKTNRPVLRFAGTGNLYHSQSGMDRLAPAMQAAECFRKTFPDEVTTYYDRESGQLAQLNGDNWRRRSGYHHDEDLDVDGITVVLRGADLLTPCEFACYLPVTEEVGRMNLPGNTFLSVPLPWVAEDPDRCIERMLDWCRLLAPEQGTFGIGVVASFGTIVRNYGIELWPWISRFSGLDVNTRFCYDRRQPNQALRAVNWLTILDDVWIEKLGGLAHLSASLHPEGSVYRYEGGAILRACTHPQMGDIKHLGVPQAYVQVDRLIRHLRYRGYSATTPMDNLKVPAPLDGNSATLDWVSRFERLETDCPPLLYRSEIDCP